MMTARTKGELEDGIDVELNSTLFAFVKLIEEIRLLFSRFRLCGTVSE